MREGSGFPPFSLVAARLAVAGVVLLVWTMWSRQRVRPTRTELALLVISGVLFWGGGNGLVTWAEQRAGAGYAALFIGATPIWASLFDAIVDRKLPSHLFIASLVAGFSGVGLLAAPILATGSQADVASLIALLGAGASWAAGSVLQARRRVAMTPFATSALQHLVGAVFFVIAALVAQEPRPQPTGEAWVALVYLIVGGSIVTFTSYLRTLHLLPTRVVMTYSYVNPIGAVLLGWLLLGESITGWTVAGAGLVLLGVAGIFRARRG